MMFFLNRIPKWLKDILLNWPVVILALWISDSFFDGLVFENFNAIVVSALILTLLNLFIKPVLLILALPLALLSLGLVIPLLNGLFIFVVSDLVEGFAVDTYLTAVFAAISLSFLTIISQMAIGSYGKSILVKSKFDKSSDLKNKNNSKSQEIVIDVEVKEKKD